MNWLSLFLHWVTSKRILYLILGLVVCFLVYKRISWDSGISPLIQSDSQIKLYQTIQYKEKGIQKHECYSKNIEIDPEFRFYPFRYPWVYFIQTRDNQKKCVFQYPTFFAQTFSLLPIPYRFLNGMILLFYFFLTLGFVYVLRSVFYIRKIEILCLGAILFLVGYSISSAIEFSESIPSHIFLLFFFYGALVLESAKKHILITSFFAGISGGISIFLRSESVIYIGVLGFFVLISNRRKITSIIKLYSPLIIGFSLAVFLLGAYNFHEFGEIFGVRSKVSLNDFGRLQFSDRLHFFKEFILGNTYRTGFLYYCFPVVLLIIFSLIKLNLTQIQKLVIGVAFVSLVFVVLLSPYSQGGLYLGLRYTEFSYLLFSIFVISLLSKDEHLEDKRWILLLIILQIVLGFYHVKRNFKTIDFVKKYHEILQSEWNKYPDAPVVHLSTFDLLLISDSFLKKPHLIANKQSEFEDLETRFHDLGISQFRVFVYDFKPPKDDNISDEFYNEWVNSKYEIESKFYRKISDSNTAGYRYMLWEKK
ncbi:LA_3751/LA_3752 family putative glycosyltransferase [Leptospira wolbachii]